MMGIESTPSSEPTFKFSIKALTFSNHNDFNDNDVLKDFISNEISVLGGLTNFRE